MRQHKTELKLCRHRTALPYASSGRHLDSKADLMARSVELVAVDIGGQSHRDTVSQLLLVAEADLRGKSTS